jgi:hypothetical protein
MSGALEQTVEVNVTVTDQKYLEINFFSQVNATLARTQMLGGLIATGTRECLWRSGF